MQLISNAHSGSGYWKNYKRSLHVLAVVGVVTGWVVVVVVVAVVVVVVVVVVGAAVVGMQKPHVLRQYLCKSLYLSCSEHNSLIRGQVSYSSAHTPAPEQFLNLSGSNEDFQGRLIPCILTFGFVICFSIMPNPIYFLFFNEKRNLQTYFSSDFEQVVVANNGAQHSQLAAMFLGSKISFLYVLYLTCF